MDINELVADALSFAEEAGLPESTISWKVFGHSKDIARLRSGGGMTIDKFNKAQARLCELRAERASSDPPPP